MIPRTLILGVLLALIGVYAITTSGILFYEIDHMGGQRDIVLAEGLKSDVWLAPTNSNIDIPFLYHHYTGGPPFALRLQIWDDSHQYRVIEVTETIAEYEDGEVVKSDDVWSRKLKYTPLYGGMYMLSDRIEGVVLRHATVKVTIKGLLKNKNEETVEFEASEHFATETSSGVITYWEYLSGV